MKITMSGKKEELILFPDVPVFGRFGAEALFPLKKALSWTYIT
jgi:hypothetical protein